MWSFLTPFSNALEARQRLREIDAYAEMHSQRHQSLDLFLFSEGGKLNFGATMFQATTEPDLDLVISPETVLGSYHLGLQRCYEPSTSQ